jgi:hypothetical protein
MRERESEKCGVVTRSYAEKADPGEKVFGTFAGRAAKVPKTFTEDLQRAVFGRRSNRRRGRERMTAMIQRHLPGT